MRRRRKCRYSSPGLRATGLTGGNHTIMALKTYRFKGRGCLPPFICPHPSSRSCFCGAHGRTQSIYDPYHHHPQGKGKAPQIPRNRMETKRSFRKLGVTNFSQPIPLTSFLVCLPRRERKDRQRPEPALIYPGQTRIVHPSRNQQRGNSHPKPGGTA